ncbi:Transcriptional regulator, LysR family [Xenorhabdus poinarii G6]|uniref:Transcriptional regulator, LysR family n=1 Tax=Xenorhabdus poinarii G6 TaxID=1354304 RepID=A0A068R8W7_9GAMM|nr:LysR family transcriptional regulator [Xenorhabdus poinarii]CDG22595.1 Transcriptional regulator, LysR family [Xenorhabdus poinarii G6]
MDNLRKLDLNLLLTLDALLKDPNVTRTARTLNLSQSTVSVQLGKLRKSLDDPLFLPGPRGMRPTARAELLRTSLRQALALLDKAVSSPGPFIPAESTHIWKIIAADYCETTVLLPVLTNLRREAPGTRLAVMENANSQIAQAVGQDKIDLFFHIREEAPQGLRCRKLFSEQYVLVSRIGHPLLKSAPTLKLFLELDYVMISPDGGGFWGSTDKALSEMGLSRKVVLSVQHFMFAVFTIATTDLVGMLPLRLVKDNPQLQYFMPPVDIPGFEMNMLWHEHLHLEPAHKWLRDLIMQSLEEH